MRMCKDTSSLWLWWDGTWAEDNTQLTHIANNNSVLNLAKIYKNKVLSYILNQSWAFKFWTLSRQKLLQMKKPT